MPPIDPRSGAQITVERQHTVAPIDEGPFLVASRGHLADNSPAEDTAAHVIERLFDYPLIVVVPVFLEEMGLLPIAVKRLISHIQVVVEGMSLPGGVVVAVASVVNSCSTR